MGLRGTQQAAYDETIKAFKRGENRVLLVEPTGWGKTYFTSFLFKSCVEQWNVNALFVVHTKELVRQTHEAFVEYGMGDISSVLCAGLGSKEVKQITVGTRQTISKNLDKLKKINLLVIDECHFMSKKDQYQEIIEACSHERIRILGLTATPYRLNEGFIYGDGKFWLDYTHITTLDQMIDLGFLSPYRYKLAQSMDDELDKIKKVAGEFSETELTELLVEDRHMQSVKKAIENHCQERKKIIVFAVSTEHADALAGVLGCHSLHSSMKKEDWETRFSGFKYGSDRIIVNVLQMTVGVNIPEVDCLVIARPTMSTANHVQQCGRALRICEGKKDALIIDMVGNYLRHGLPSNPKVRGPKEKQEPKEKKEKQSSVCHMCFEVVEDEDICPYCGAELKGKKEINEINEKMKLIEIEAEKLKHRVIRWGEKQATTKQGNVGVRFWLVVTNRKDPVFKFCGNGTSKAEKTREKLRSLQAGDIVDIVQTAYGPWIA